MDTTSGASPLEVRRLGRVPYAQALELQEQLRGRLARAEGPETILLLEHPDVITYGRGAKDGNTRLGDTDLRRLGYDVFRVNRGGDVTWHGPGQLVGYPLLDLERHGSDVHLYLRALEGALIAALEGFGRRWLTLHGFALNVCCDLARFDVIVPCGLPGVRMVSMASVLGREPDFAEVTSCVEDALRKAFA
jgi:lipoate-protein ligase B